MIILYSKQVNVFIFFLSELPSMVHPVAIYILILIWLLWYKSLFLTLIILLFWKQSSDPMYIPAYRLKVSDIGISLE